MKASIAKPAISRLKRSAVRSLSPRPMRPLNVWAKAGAWVGCLTGALLAAALWAPATWLAQGLAQASQGQLMLIASRGTIWQGSAELVLSGGSGSRDRMRLPGRVHWTLSPMWLSPGPALGLALRADCCTPDPLQLTVRSTAPGWHIQLMDSVKPSLWPTALLGGLGTPWNTLQPSGSLRLSSRQLQTLWVDGQWQFSGQAEVELHQFASGLSTLRPLGSYRLVIQGGQPVQISLDTLEGGLRLSGSGQWVSQQLRFSGEATAEAGREAALNNFLNVLGRRDGPRSIITLGAAS